MEIVDVFYQSDVVDCSTWVTDKRDPNASFYTMLATDSDGHMFSQWTEGRYDPAAEN